MFFVKRLVAPAMAAALVLGATSIPAVAQMVSVVVNGAGLSFDQPPVERAGRVFVPLRGVFERLGASVVYANGVINATGNGRHVHLTIGSTQAIVDGQTVYMDVAPFLIGARTLVPLRFVAQSLGAAVNWNGSNNTVYINSNGNVAPAAAPTPYRTYGTTTNAIGRFNPAPNTRVNGSFILSGYTRPGSSVTVSVVATTSTVGRSFNVVTARYSNGTTADAKGDFSVPINISVNSGGSLHVTIVSLSPTGVRVQRVIAYAT
jgi:hypothetical protein